MTRDSEIELAVSEVAEALRQGLEEHPEASQLSAYHRQALTPADRVAVQDHLALCPECSGLMLDLADFDQLAASSEAQAWQARQPAVWRSLQDEIATVEPDRVAIDLSPRRWWLLAALLVVVLGGLVWQTLQLGRARQDLVASRQQLVWAEQTILQLEQTASEQEPQVFVPRIDLFPAGYQRSGAVDSLLLVPRISTMVVLQLHLLDLDETQRHRLRVSTAQGQQVWLSGVLPLTDAGTYRVGLPKGQLPSGRYRLELVGSETAGRTLAHYEMVVEAQ